MSGISRRLLWLRRRCCLVATSFSRIVAVDIRYPVIGCQTVGFDFLMIFSFIDDDCSCVVANVDNVVQVIVRVVERVAEFFLRVVLLKLVLDFFFRKLGSETRMQSESVVFPFMEVSFLESSNSSFKSSPN